VEVRLSLDQRIPTGCAKPGGNENDHPLFLREPAGLLGPALGRAAGEFRWAWLLLTRNRWRLAVALAGISSPAS